MLATTYELSKKLLELGLPWETGDMQLQMNPFKKLLDCWDLDVGLAPKLDGHMPAWSLNGLHKVIPKHLDEFGSFSVKYSRIWDSYIVGYIDDARLWQKQFIKTDEFAATYEFVCWLLENDLIKKEDIEIMGNIHDNPELLK